jgi:hypothetical protein
MKDELEMVELKCDGCRSRDEIIRQLAERIDELERECRGTSEVQR